ncbi:peptidylprolyl isomerase [Natronosporangium hydrolyticum]|uniref:peptidylprolyl isomerase n=2 Tax=Natronosporangium hydrolyticum TaxID=2811111 RepID=A0A895YMQ7_9ACTN|nr:peptidylprolyl isomerase [Natronosporangium hydrolyticum]
MIEKLSAHLIRSVEPDHRPCVDVLGAIWRYPRLAAVIDRHWGRYLAGLVAREECLTDLANELGGRHPRWYVEDVDATSLAADFYVLEWLSAAGCDEAQRRFAQWVPGLADYFARQIDLTIGGELGHFERARRHRLPEPVGSFIERVTAGDSRVAWWRTRRELGQLRALTLAAETFNGPGLEYGGEAWGPVAATLRRYLELEIPPAIFVDQCFSLEHNNGSLFDKYFATEGLRELLDAQAAGDLLALTARASVEVRRLWHRHRARHRAGYDPQWLWAEAEALVDSPTPILARSSAAPVSSSIGSLGCGSALAPEVYSAEVGDEPNAPQPWRGVSRRRPPPPLHGGQGCRGVAVLYTTVGPITIELWPTSAPHTVDAFVGLARGTLAWQDPITRQTGVGGFYDHTTFHRRIPGFLIQGGDRSETGEGGPGFRIPDEFDSTSVFDRPYLVAMANTGPNSAGSQFFITLAAAPHLNGGYSRFGEVTDRLSRERVRAIADATGPVINERVDVTIW